MDKAKRRIRSKQRVADHGEVFTGEREVKAMLDLVKQETEKIESRFFEPACGHGNFLAEILRRKLAVVKSRYKKHPADFERYSFLAVTGIYGIDILEDNVEECQRRLFRIWDKAYWETLKSADVNCRKAVDYILNRNILCGDVLTAQRADSSPIVLAEWTPINANLLKRRDFRLDQLVQAKNTSDLQMSLFLLEETIQDQKGEWVYDEKTKAFVPLPIREFPPIYYKRVQEYSCSAKAATAVRSAKFKKASKMEFDVIVGNPPYQLSDGGGMGTSAVPLYQKFVKQAKNMQPRYLSMIIPARWYAGGKGLASFRRNMLNDRRIRELHDYFDATACFPGIDLSGGACYFLWERDNPGDCKVTSNLGERHSVMRRPLLIKGNDTFIRFNEAIPILAKVNRENFQSFSKKVSPRRPFGLPSSVEVKEKGGGGMIKVFAYPQDGYIPRERIGRKRDWVEKYKVLLAKAYGERGDFPYLVTAKPFLGEPGTCCSETYLVMHTAKSREECENVISYLATRFFRFLVLLKKNTQNTSRSVYSLAPVQDFSQKWTDEKLYVKYGLTEKETEFIESLVRPMHLA